MDAKYARTNQFYSAFESIRIWIKIENKNTLRRRIYEIT